MFPIRDDQPSFSKPFVTYFIIVLNVVVFVFFELPLQAQGPRAINGLILQFGLIPRDFTRALTGATDYPLAANLLTVLTSMFMHGGFTHILGNMWFLWIFGDNVEDRLGHFTYLIFYLLCGLGAGIVHTILNYNVDVPSIGASGAIAGVLGAYLVSYPGARILTLIPIFIFMQIIEIPAIIVLGFWFIMQFLSGTASLASATANAGGVAWWAHVGGFVIGMILVGMFPRRDRPRYEY